MAIETGAKIITGATFTAGIGIAGIGATGAAFAGAGATGAALAGPTGVAFAGAGATGTGIAGATGAALAEATGAVLVGTEITEMLTDIAIIPSSSSEHVKIFLELMKQFADFFNR